MIDKIDWWHRIRMPNGEYTPGKVKHGEDGGNWPTERFGMPEDLKGKVVLDIGCWDGFFSFEAEGRGADFVMAIDAARQTEGFKFAKDMLKSKVEWSNHDIQNIWEGRGADVVLCYGVLYHVKSPLIVMENLFGLTNCGGVCLVETAISHHLDAVLEYRPHYGGDVNNFFYPNVKWMELAAKEVGFKNCEKIWADHHRATFRMNK